MSETVSELMQPHAEPDRGLIGIGAGEAHGFRMLDRSADRPWNRLVCEIHSGPCRGDPRVSAGTGSDGLRVDW